MMDKLRTAGPWESEQTHDSLRRYLLEETYELFDAVRGGNADELREELGDVLLQVLFHARIAEDAPQHPFTIDDVADALVRKLGNRVPAVLAGESISLEEQLAQWEERKALEKRRSRVRRPWTTCRPGSPRWRWRRRLLERVSAGGAARRSDPGRASRRSRCLPMSDAENALRSAVLEFMDDVRRVEHAIAAGRRGDDVPEELDVATLGAISEEEWRAALAAPRYPTNSTRRRARAGRRAEPDRARTVPSSEPRRDAPRSSRQVVDLERRCRPAR